MSGCFTGWATAHRFTVPGRTGTRTVINCRPEATRRSMWRERGIRRDLWKFLENRKEP